jgi:hypothetical protein
MAVKKKAVRLRRRNAARGSSSGPGMENTLAAVLGGGGGALLGGLLVRWGVSPEMSALAMTVGGGVAAYTLSGTVRTAASGLAAAGAGQLALALLAKEASKEADKVAATPATSGKPANALLPPGAVYEAFQRARAIELDDDDYVEERAAA